MKKQISMIFAMFALLLVSASVFAVQAKGTGTVVAEGKGEMSLAGNGTVTIETKNMGATIWFRGTDNIRVSGEWTTKTFGSWTKMTGNGQVTIRGENISVIAKGEGKVTGTGSGFAMAHGKGTWKVMGKKLVLKRTLAVVNAKAVAIAN